MALIWRVLPLLFLANTVFAKIDYDIFAYPYCIKDGASIEFGRIKGEKYQVSFAHRFGLFNNSQFKKDNEWLLVDSFFGFGMRKLLEKDGSRERGFLIWPFSTDQPEQVQKRIQISRATLAQFYYRVNTRFVSFEAGIIGTISTDPIARIYLGVSK